jgi:excisionase family DNA binding protein
MQENLCPRPPLTVVKAKAWLGCCEQTVRNLFAAGQLRGFRVGRKILVYADSVEDFKTRKGNCQAEPAPAEPLAQPGPAPTPSPTPRRRRGVRDFDRHAGS